MVQRVVSVRAIDDPADQHKGGIACQLILLQDRLKGTLLTVVTKLDIFDVIRNGFKPLCLSHHLIGRCKDKLGVLVDELLDEPGASHTIDLDVFASNPLHRILLSRFKSPRNHASAKTRSPPW